MNLQFNSLEEFESFVAAMGYSKDGQTAKAEPKKLAAVKDEPAKPTATAPVTQKEIDDTNKAAQANLNGSNGAITLEDIRAVGGQLAQANKSEQVKTALGKYGVKKIGDLKPGDYPKFHAEITALL